MFKLLNGKIASKSIANELKVQFGKFNNPKMVIFQVGDNPASNKYIKFKKIKGEQLGVVVDLVKFEGGIKQDELIYQINEHISKYDAGIVQLPLPSSLDKQLILDAIPSDKDIDGLSTNAKFVPATPIGIEALLNYYDIELNNKSIGVIGQSRLVGAPTTKIMQGYSDDVSSYDLSTGVVGIKKHDVIIVAAGETKLIKEEMVKDGVVIVDVGINEIADENAMKRIVGDVDFESVSKKTSAISPVPGGVGPMTVISLFSNLLKALKK